MNKKYKLYIRTNTWWIYIPKKFSKTDDFVRKSLDIDGTTSEEIVQKYADQLFKVVGSISPALQSVSRKSSVRQKKKAAGITIQKCLETFISTRTSNSTRETYHSLGRRIIRFLGADTCVTEVNVIDIEQFKIAMLRSYKKNSTNCALALLSAAFNFVEDAGMVIFKRKPKFKRFPREGRIEFFSDKEMDIVIDAAYEFSKPYWDALVEQENAKDLILTRGGLRGTSNQRAYFGLLVEMYFETGSRLNELALLEWKELKIYQTVEDGIAGQLNIDRSKGGNPLTRYLTLPTLNKVLRIPKVSERIFHCTGKPENWAQNYQRFFKSLMSTLDISKSESMTIHNMRHTFGTRGVRKGDVTVVNKMLGHKKLETTMLYVHVLGEQQRELFSRMNNEK